MTGIDSPIHFFLYHIHVLETWRKYNDFICTLVYIHSVILIHSSKGPSRSLQGLSPFSPLRTNDVIHTENIFWRNLCHFIVVHFCLSKFKMDELLTLNFKNTHVILYIANSTICFHIFCSLRCKISSQVHGMHICHDIHLDGLSFCPCLKKFSLEKSKQITLTYLKL